MDGWVDRLAFCKWEGIHSSSVHSTWGQEPSRPWEDMELTVWRWDGQKQVLITNMWLCNLICSLREPVKKGLEDRRERLTTCEKMPACFLRGRKKSPRNQQPLLVYRTFPSSGTFLCCFPLPHPPFLPFSCCQFIPEVLPSSRLSLSALCCISCLNETSPWKGCICEL